MDTTFQGEHSLSLGWGSCGDRHNDPLAVTQHHPCSGAWKGTQLSQLCTPHITPPLSATPPAKTLSCISKI